MAYYLDILLPPGDVRAREQLERIQNLVEQANWIVDDAVHFTQSSPSTPVPVSLDDVVAQAFGDRNRGGKLNVHLELGSSPCQALLDPKQARHLVASLLGFFRQIAATGTPVHVGTECVAGGVGLRLACQLAVPGLQVAEMFEPGNRRLPAGMGLTLAAAQRILETHSGTIEIDSDVPQRVTLSVRFPAAR